MATKSGAQITIYYNDQSGSVSKLIGTLIEQTNYTITVKRNTDQKIVTVPFSKVVRVESDE